MAEHEPCIGASDNWYTPPEIFTALSLQFDLDPASGEGDFVPAYRKIRLPDDGLLAPWSGLIWMNPPFGGRNGQVPWLQKFNQHMNGIALVAARTSSGWWHDLVPSADCIVFPRGKTKFIRPDGSVGKSPGTGIALIGIGQRAYGALKQCDLGMFLRIGA